MADIYEEGVSEDKLVATLSKTVIYIATRKNGVFTGNISVEI